MSMGCSHFSQGDEKVHLCYRKYQPYNVTNCAGGKWQVLSLAKLILIIVKKTPLNSQGPNIKSNRFPKFC